MFVCDISQSGSQIAHVVTPFVPSKHLALVAPQLETAVEVGEDGIKLSVSTKQLARFVEISIGGSDAPFSDNYFDLPAGGTKRVTVANAGGFSKEELEGRLQVRSLRFYG